MTIKETIIKKENEVIVKKVIKKLSEPVHGYLYDVQIWTSVDFGKTFCYCGNGKFFQTKEKAENFDWFKENRTEE